MWWRGVFLLSDCDVTQKGQQRKPELVPLMCFIYWQKKGQKTPCSVVQCSAGEQRVTQGTSKAA